MKISRETLERMAKDALRSALEGIPFARVQTIEKGEEFGGSRPNLVATVATPAGIRYFVSVVRSTGQPRAAREAINLLWRSRENRQDVVPVFIAPYISPASAQLCTQDGTGYVDLSGNCRLSFDNSFVEREGRANAFAEKRDLRSLYSPKAARVLRVLLANPGEPWKIKELAGEAEVSLGLASNVKKLLEDREWTRRTEDGLMLVAPMKLLAEWAENYPIRHIRARDYVTRKPVGDLEADLVSACREKMVPYALTGLSAASRMTRMVRPSHVMAYIGEPLDEVTVAAGLKEAPGGANVTLLEPYDDGVFYGAIEEEGIRLASPVQVYLDLTGFRGRGEGAARTILDELIRPQW